MLKQGIEASLKIIAETIPDIYSSCLEQYFQFDHLLNLSPDHLLNLAFKTTSGPEVSNLLDSATLQLKEKWLTAYFVHIPEEQIDRSIVVQLVERFASIEKDYLPGQIGFLEKYINLEPLIFEQIVNILIAKSSDDATYGFPLFDLFNKYSEVNKKLFDIFPKDSPTVFKAYLCAYTATRDIDHDGSTLSRLIERDPAFLLRFVDKVYEVVDWPSVHTNMPDITFLWDGADYLEVVNSLVEHIAQTRDTDFPRLSHTLIEKLFPTGDGLSRKAAEPRAEVVEFLKFAIRKHHDNRPLIYGLFDIIKHMLPDVRLNMITFFVGLNDNFELFKHIDLLPNSGWSGSRVPTLIADLNFLEKLLLLLNGVEYLQHKRLINQWIDDTKKSIAREKKSDFIGEF